MFKRLVNLWKLSSLNLEDFIEVKYDKEHNMKIKRKVRLAKIVDLSPDINLDD